jgi:hypothetical protein
MTTLSNTVTLPNNGHRTKQSKFHLLIIAQRMYSISTSTTEILLLKGDRAIATVTGELVITHQYSSFAVY